MVAVVQLSIACGSTVGGTLFDVIGYQATFAASAGILLVAASFERPHPPWAPADGAGCDAQGRVRDRGADARTTVSVEIPVERVTDQTCQDGALAAGQAVQGVGDLGGRAQAGIPGSAVPEKYRNGRDKYQAAAAFGLSSS